MVEIIKTDWGVAHRIGDRIYINKNIDDRSILYKRLIEHEFSHSDSLNLEDIMLDINNPHLEGIKSEYYKFLFKNPKSLIIFLPIYYHKKRLQIDVAMIIIWLFAALIFGSIIIFK